ncbi:MULTISPECIES: hypothetical protein [unclassified Sinorhizobium]|uniref:hypothetical protein n=1 Tax=unclassified Sinorhizobium TaxID=2613772 RepID=UPI00352393AD
MILFIVSLAFVKTDAWIDCLTGGVIDEIVLMKNLLQRKVISLGEVQGRHQAWRLDVIGRLASVVEILQLDWKCFPEAHKVPSTTGAGGDVVSEQEFLEGRGWKDFWRLDPSLYLPIFQDSAAGCCIATFPKNEV